MVVFYRQTHTYNSQGLVRLEKPQRVRGKKIEESIYRVSALSKDTETLYTKYPRQTLHCKYQREGLHPTQKTVELFEYLIRTYTNPGEVVLDNCMGGGMTAVVCINTGRSLLGMRRMRYYRIALDRINELSNQFAESFQILGCDESKKGVTQLWQRLVVSYIPDREYQME